MCRNGLVFSFDRQSLNWMLFFTKSKTLTMCAFTLQSACYLSNWQLSHVVVVVVVVVVVSYDCGQNLYLQTHIFMTELFIPCFVCDQCMLLQLKLACM